MTTPKLSALALLLLAPCLCLSLRAADPAPAVGAAEAEQAARIAQAAAHKTGYALLRAKERAADARAALEAAATGPDLPLAIGAAIALPGLAMSMGASPESALDLLETHRRRIALRPDFTPRYHNAFDRTRTYYLRRLGRTAEAIALAEKIVAAVPTAPNYLLQAQIKADAGDVDGALAAYTLQLVKLDPATPDKALGTWSAMVRLCRKHAAYDRAGLLRHCDAILALYLAMPPPAGTSITLWREQWAPFIGLVSGLQAQLQTQILNAPPAAQ